MDSDSEYDEYTMYTDSEDDHHEDDDCICGDCGNKIKDHYDPPITRLQKRKQLNLITTTKKLIECYNNFSYYLFEYMTEQRDYTKHELEKKLDDHYMTEEEYRELYDKIKDKYENQKELLEMYNDIRFIQTIMKKNDYNMFIDDCNDRYKNTIEFIFILKSNIEVLNTKT